MRQPSTIAVDRGWGGTGPLRLSTAAPGKLGAAQLAGDHWTRLWAGRNCGPAGPHAGGRNRALGPSGPAHPVPAPVLMVRAPVPGVGWWLRGLPPAISSGLWAPDFGPW